MLLKYRCKCKKCKTEFKSSGLPEQSYGEFILRSKTGYEAYLMACNNKEYEEFSSFVEENKKVKSTDQFVQAKIIKTLFSMACDKAPDGSVYEIYQNPMCPNCKSTEVGIYGPENPPEFYISDMKEVQYKSWNSLSKSEKKRLINEEILKIDLSHLI